MTEEPVDRRGLFRDLFRQAGDAIVPALGARLGPLLPETPRTRAAARPAATVRQLLEAGSELGLDARAETIERLARHSLRLVPAAYTSAEALRFGGRPLLEENREWPLWGGRPLTFLGQVETGEPLGRLQFFYDVVGRPSGCLAAHRGSARVLRAGGGRLIAGDGPALPTAALAGELVGELVVPPVGSPAVEGLELSHTERAGWEMLRAELASMQGLHPPQSTGAAFRVVHRLFGYPDSPAGEMPLVCEIAAAGEDVIEGRARMHPKAAELEGRAARWELLAQFSGDGKLGWPWVAQRVYFWVDRDALGEGDLEQVWAIAR